MKEGIVFSIQHYAVHDGPGIRTLVFLKGCSLRCPWCSNPESQEAYPELLKSSILCKDCKLCQSVCPYQMKDRTQCKNCDTRACAEACPYGALRFAGKKMTAAEVMKEVLLDRDFYRNSGGGLTLSGGEPLLQDDFCEEILKRSKEEGIHTAVETAGNIPLETMKRLEPFIDYFLYDLKILDEQKHLAFIGASNESILNNLRYLSKIAPRKVQVRIPVIPKFTDQKNNIDELLSFTSSLGLSAPELMPYHEFGRDKYEELGRKYSL